LFNNISNCHISIAKYCAPIEYQHKTSDWNQYVWRLDLMGYHIIGNMVIFNYLFGCLMQFSAPKLCGSHVLPRAVKICMVWPCTMLFTMRQCRKKKRLGNRVRCRSKAEDRKMCGLFYFLDTNFAKILLIFYVRIDRNPLYFIKASKTCKIGMKTGG
jgi:hypothetical protein